MVSAYINCGRPREGLKLYNQMLESRTQEPNEFMYSAVLKACSLVGDAELGKLIHQDISRSKLQFDTALMNALLDMYAKCGILRDAQQVFNAILCKNSISWNTLILGYTKEGLMDEALELFNQMPEPDLIHCHTIKSGFESNIYNISALIDMYSNCKFLNEAVKIFDQHSMSCPVTQGLALWNSMLSGYVANEDYTKALNMIAHIHHSGGQFDSYSFSIALKICIYFKNLRLTSQVHGLVITCGYELYYVVGSILIDLYAKQGNIDSALRLFERMSDKDIVAWSSLIAGCARLGLGALAFSLFTDMVKLDLEIDQFVISSVLKVSSSLSSLRSGQQIHAYCVKKGYESEGVTTTSLIDMYAKCGDIDDGLALFSCLSGIDTVCWTGIIVGCAQNGRAVEAIMLLQEMIESGFQPNEITFIGVLTACRHAGLVKEAWAIFNSIKTEHGLIPCPEHYHCMVDLFGRSGHFKEAAKLINDMPFEPDKTIWQSLLTACAMHKNQELAKIVAEHLLATTPEDSSTYVMVSNVYGTLGMWDSLSQVREVVKKVGKKQAGKSWIEITS
ncbi:hypothetical protein K1719_034845 [Acacia pycnantha]|nr:hypothetical protein K1719_034845 [Acacia pycnantha]